MLSSFDDDDDETSSDEEDAAGPDVYTSTTSITLTGVLPLNPISHPHHSRYHFPN